MKNFIRSKGFLFSVLVAACIGILTVCFVANREPKSDFQPEEAAANTDTQEAPATPAPAVNAGNRPSTNTPAPAATKDPMEGYPKVVDESDDEVVINFTPEGGELLEDPPEPPAAGGDTTDPAASPDYAPEETEPEPTAPPAQDNTPAPGSTNGNGAVYDPVFKPMGTYN